MLHNMKNDYRAGKKVLHLVVEGDLHVAVKSAAATAGVSITEFVTSVLEKEVGHGSVGVGSGDRVGFASSGSVDGAHGGRGSGSDTQSGASGRGVDWDSLLLAGKKAKASVGSIDPIQEIA
jgi:hypothetical protein